MNKCLCPCPDYIKVPIEHGMTETYLLKGFGTVLHGKKADRACEECGRGLCEDCMIPHIGIAHILEGGEIIDECISCWCPACAEDIRAENEVCPDCA